MLATSRGPLCQHNTFPLQAAPATCLQAVGCNKHEPLANAAAGTCSAAVYGAVVHRAAGRRKYKALNPLLQT
jgi:hypothetical protein